MGLFKKKVVKVESDLDLKIKRIRELESNLESDIKLFKEVSNRIGSALRQLYCLKYYRPKNFIETVWYKDKRYDIDAAYDKLLLGIESTYEDVLVDNPTVLVEFDKENWRPFERFVEKSDFPEEEVRKFSGYYNHCECGRWVSKVSPLCTCGKKFELEEYYSYSFMTEIHDDCDYDEETDTYNYFYVERKIQIGKDEYRYEIEDNNGNIIPGRLGVIPLEEVKQKDTKIE